MPQFNEMLTVCFSKFSVNLFQLNPQNINIRLIVPRGEILVVQILNIMLHITRKLVRKQQRRSFPVQFDGCLCYTTIKSMMHAQVMGWLMWAMMRLERAVPGRSHARWRRVWCWFSMHSNASVLLSGSHWKWFHQHVQHTHWCVCVFVSVCARGPLHYLPHAVQSCLTEVSWRDLVVVASVTQSDCQSHLWGQEMIKCTNTHMHT